jgi:hypothetical protein
MTYKGIVVEAVAVVLSIVACASLEITHKLGSQSRMKQPNHYFANLKLSL